MLLVVIFLLLKYCIILEANNAFYISRHAQKKLHNINQIIMNNNVIYLADFNNKKVVWIRIFSDPIDVKRRNGLVFFHHKKKIYLLDLQGFINQLYNHLVRNTYFNYSNVILHRYIELYLLNLYSGYLKIKIFKNDNNANVYVFNEYLVVIFSKYMIIIDSNNKKILFKMHYKTDRILRINKKIIICVSYKEKNMITYLYEITTL